MWMRIENFEKEDPLASTRYHLISSNRIFNLQRLARAAELSWWVGHHVVCEVVKLGLTLGV